MLESSDASTSKIDEKSRMAAIASEDIFDLSSPAEQEANSPAVAEVSRMSPIKTYRKTALSSPFLCFLCFVIWSCTFFMLRVLVLHAA